MRQFSTCLTNFGQRDIAVLVAVLSFLLLQSDCPAQGTLTIDFEGPPIQPPQSDYVTTNYVERGTRFVGNYSRARPAGLTRWPDNGTTHIKPAWSPVACSRFDGLSFRLVSVDLAGYSSVLPNVTATFEGHRADGSIVTTNFAVNGIVFQTHDFSSEFVELTNVLVTAGALDNLVMKVPATPPVLSMGVEHYQGNSWVNLYAEGTAGLPYRLEYADLDSKPLNWLTFTNFESGFSWVEQVSKTTAPRRIFRAVLLP